jgi:hypothetical protein
LEEEGNSLTYSDALGKGSDVIRKNYWLLIIPIISDMLLLVIKYLSTGVFIDTARIPQFQLKFALPTALPSLKNVIDAFPDLISYNTNTGFQNTVLTLTNTIPQPWKNIYMVCCLLLFAIFTAFLRGGLLGSMVKTYKTGEKATLKDFIFFSRYYWSRFLGLNILGFLAILVALAFIPIVFIYFIASLFIFYLSYALVWDDVSVLEAISRAVSRFTSRFGNTLGFMIYIAFFLGLLSLIVVPLSRFNVFLGSILYNVCACYFVAAILIMYAGDRINPVIESESNSDGHVDVKI